MEPTTPTERAAYRRRLPIEKYALLTENAPEIDRILQEWYDFYRPATPGECTLLDIAVMAHVQQQRVLGCLTETVNNAIRTARFQFDCNQEDQVQRYRDLLETQPGVAVVGLNRSALGVRFLIGRWERLLRLLEEEGTLYGNDRDEYIRYQGARATRPEDLHESEGAYLTWIYCLMCQPKPRRQDIIDIGNLRYMPAGINDRDGRQWMGEADVCRKLLKGLAEEHLAHLRPREELLRTHYEIPAREGAEVRAQVLQGPVGVQLQRNADAHERQYLRAYNAFLKGRAQSEKSERLPGEPCPVLHGASVVRPEPAPDTGSAERAGAERKQVAAALAPGGENGIGAPSVHGDGYQAVVRAANGV